MRQSVAKGGKRRSGGAGKRADTSDKKEFLYNREPNLEFDPDTAPIDDIRAEFAARLQKLMSDAGWNQSETARQVAKQMPGKKFNRDNIFGYIHGMRLPRVEHADAIAKTFRVSRDYLLPRRAVTSVEDARPKMRLTEAGAGQIHLEVNMTIPMELAAQILAILTSIESGQR